MSNAMNCILPKYSSGIQNRGRPAALISRSIKGRESANILRLIRAKSWMTGWKLLNISSILRSSFTRLTSNRHSLSCSKSSDESDRKIHHAKSAIPAASAPLARRRIDNRSGSGVISWLSGNIRNRFQIVKYQG